MFNFKRALSVCLAITMVAVSASVSFAATGTDPDGNDSLVEKPYYGVVFEEDDANDFMQRGGAILNKIQKKETPETHLVKLKEELIDDFGAEAVQKAEKIVRANYTSEPEYFEHVEKFGKTDIEIMIFTSVGNYLRKGRPLLKSSTSTYAWVVAPNVNQQLYYYCGPASALQAIAGWGGYVKGNTNKKKMDTLAKQMGTTTDGSSYTAVASTLNKYASDYPYGYKSGKDMDVDEFLNTCYDSLADDYAPIIQCRTEELDYYGGHISRHFITISGADLDTEKVRLVDPNYRQEYFGIRTISAGEAFGSIDFRDRHLISANIQ